MVAVALEKRPKGSRKKGKKNRKYGRCVKQPTHIRYSNEARWVKNKAKRIVRELKKHPNWKPYNLNEDVQKAIAKLMAA